MSPCADEECAHDQAVGEEEVSRAMSEAKHLRLDLAGAEEREMASRKALVEAQRALAASQAEAGRLRAAAAGANERRGELEADLERVRDKH